MAPPSRTSSTWMTGWRRGWSRLGRHWPFVAVLVAGAIVRVATEVTRLPGVYQDSLIYLRLAEHAPWAPFSPTRPSGYPLALRFIGAVVDGLDAITAVQHGAGLVVAVLLYLVLVRSGVRRWLAVVAAAIVAFDSYTIALEQGVLAETLFTLTLMASLVLAARARTVRGMAVSGLLLALSVTMRTVGLFVVPVWVAWVGWFLWTRCSRRAVVVPLAALALPIVAYASLHAADGAGFNLVDGDGWYLYAKVGPIVDCSGASVPEETRPLCVEPVSDDPNFYLYNAESPAYRLFLDGQPVDLEVGITHHNNGLLRRFSRSMILANPVEYGGVVTRDFVDYFLPARAPGELSLYGTPGSLMIRYERWLHIRWWMVAGALVGGVAALGAARYRRTSLLFLGSAVGLVVGAAATAAFNTRYIVPVVPLLLAAGIPGIDDAIDRLTASRRRRGRKAGPADAEAHTEAEAEAG